MTAGRRLAIGGLDLRDTQQRAADRANSDAIEIDECRKLLKAILSAFDKQDPDALDDAILNAEQFLKSSVPDGLK